MPFLDFAPAGERRKNRIGQQPQQPELPGQIRQGPAGYGQAQPIPAAPGAPAAPGKANQRKSYTNLQDLLGLNQDYAQQTGQGMTEKASGAIQGAQIGLQSAQNTYGQATKQATQKYDPNATKEQREARAGAAYSGPESLESVRPGLEGQVQNAQELAQQATTQGGRQSLLQQQEAANTQGTAAGGYGQGASAFDAYLAGQGAQQQIGENVSSANELEKALGLANEQAGAQRQAAVSASEAARGQYAANPEPAGPAGPTAENIIEANAMRTQERQANMNRKDNLRHITTEELVEQQYGMSLEQWIAAGKPPLK